MKKQILITGGAGFVGSHLADGLLKAGHHVRILDDLTPQVHQAGLPDYLSRNVELIVGDVRDPSRLTEALRNVDVVFHFAATVGVGQSMYEISRYMSVNTQGTAELLQAMLDAKHTPEKLIVASSMSIYGEGSYICSECSRQAAPPVRPIAKLRSGDWDLQCEACSGLLRPLPTREDKPSEINSVYALSKRDQEQLCLIYGRNYGIPVTALRFFNIYGTRQALSNPYTGVAAVFASRMLNGNAPLVFEDGEQMRDFVSIHDIVQRKYARNGEPGIGWGGHQHRLRYTHLDTPRRRDCWPAHWGKSDRRSSPTNSVPATYVIVMPTSQRPGTYWDTSRRSATSKASANWRNGWRDQQAEDKAEIMLQGAERVWFNCVMESKSHAGDVGQSAPMGRNSDGAAAQKSS